MTELLEGWTCGDHDGPGGGVCPTHGFCHVCLDEEHMKRIEELEALAVAALADKEEAERCSDKAHDALLLEGLKVDHWIQEAATFAGDNVVLREAATAGREAEEELRGQVAELEAQRADAVQLALEAVEHARAHQVAVRERLAGVEALIKIIAEMQFPPGTDFAWLLADVRAAAIRAIAALKGEQ